MPRYRPDPQAVARARRLLERHGHRLRPDERQQALVLLGRIERGEIGRTEVLKALAKPLQERGLTFEQALRRLRRTPYYSLFTALLPPE